MSLSDNRGTFRDPATASERIREAATRELAIELLGRITTQDGWNEGATGALAQALADFIDPSDHSVNASLAR